MAHLSSPVSSLKSHYAVVVIGSGYGGGIAASRLARAGQSVCVLERGREFRPGEYPDTQSEALEQVQLQLPNETKGSTTGLYDFHVDSDINVFRGCGLGGTSLVNANVSLKADPRVFDDARWPAAIRADTGGLDAGYREAQRMLDPKPYPVNWPRLAKQAAHERSAAAMDWPYCRVPINVTLEDGVNQVGVEQSECTLCGDCVTGCNYGAKNTTLMNYLPDAWNHGADIFCETSVRWIERSNGRWRIHYEPAGGGRDRFDADPDLVITADVVVLAAGTLGSTEILLRSAEHGLALSPRLGHGFTGNGDVLGFGYNNDIPIHGIGFGSRDAKAIADHARTGEGDVGGLAPVGPCITGAIDARGTAALEDGVIIEEGSIPGALGSLIPRIFSWTSKLHGQDTDPGIRDFVEETKRELDSLVRGPYVGAVNHTQTYLVMAHDDHGELGHMTLKDDRLRIHWPDVARRPAFTRINGQLRDATAALGGTYLPNPTWSNRFDKELVTVHPLGGCSMADNGAGGVTNHKGQVFDGTGDSCHAGLYVMDGAVIPMPLGVNPLFTISAVAERSVALLAKDYKWSFDYKLPSSPTGRKSVPQTVGVQFTESMKGFITKTDTHATPDTTVANYLAAAALAGEGDLNACRFILTLCAPDLDGMLADPNHRMVASGTVEAPLLSRTPLQVVEGTFDCLPDNPERIGEKNMIYSMRLTSKEGADFCFHGYKVVRDDLGLDMWSDTTTLYVTIHKGRDRSGPVFARGVLHISVSDLSQQLRTIQATGTESKADATKAVAKFGVFFNAGLMEVYGGVFVGPTSLDPDAPSRKIRPLRVDPPDVHRFDTGDGKRLMLTRYCGGTKGPVLLAHGLGVSSRIFTIDTIETNLVEYLFANGYDVWAWDYRTSIRLETVHEQSNADQVATIDYPETVAKVLELSGRSSLQVIAHCYGATTFTMAMLDGLKHVRSAVISQISAQVDVSTVVGLKSGLHLPTVLEELGFDALTAYTDSDGGWLDKLYDRALRVLPIDDDPGENPVSKRISFMYAQLYEFDQLNTATYDSLHEMFGIANVAAFKHLGAITRAGKVVDSKGADVYTPHAARMAIPICFIHGAENKCFLPSSTEKTLAWLKGHNGSHLYRRHVIPNYGHIDCIFGKNASRDVYPHVVAHLDETARADS